MVARYWNIWKAMVAITIARHVDVRLDFVAFFLGKMIRMLILFGFTASVFRFTPVIGGFGKGELLLLFAVMNFLDVVVQLFCRGLAHVHEEIHKGTLDAILTKPFSPLFWSAFRIFDLFDLTTLPVVFLLFWYALAELPFGLEPWLVLQSMFLLGISLTIAFAFNIIIATVGFWTEMGAGYGPWFLYRHLLGAARLPDEMFPTSIRFMLTFLVPFFLMVAFPVRALFDKLSGVEMVFAASLAVAWMSFALLLWRLSIRHYTSASS